MPPSQDASTAPFDAIDRDQAEAGPVVALDRLIDHLDASGDARALLDALLLKARVELGLPPVQVGPASEIPEPARSSYEDRYVEAVRRVGGKLLDAGDVVAAWPYYRVLGEAGPVARAIEAYVPSGEPDDERLGRVVDVAFNQGAHPRRGFELILEHFGACSAITAFEHLPADEATRVPSADRLVRHLHASLAANLRGEIARRGQPLPPEGAPIRDLVAGRDWLFLDDAYHLDVSHLSAVVRFAPILLDPATIALAVDLADYGSRLSERHRYPGESPFEATYADHSAYLRALLGDDIDGAVARFREKLPAIDPDVPPEDRFVDPMPAQVLVRLLLRLGRHEEAIDVSEAHLVGLPESQLICPGIAALCQAAGRPDRLARIARDRGDLVQYAAATLRASRTG